MSNEKGSGIGDAISGTVDGAMKLVGLKDGGLDGFAERLGVVLAVGIPAIVLHSRFVVKPALKAADNGKLIANSIPLSSFTFGSMD